VAAGFDISKQGSAAYLNSAEMYDPAGDQWTLTGYLSVARSQHEAAALTAGKVLVAGGTGGNPLVPHRIHDRGAAAVFADCAC
jgi:hypothetical protein